jgi:large subunit ribosomal protein L6
VVFRRRDDDASSRALHGTMRALVNNMVNGVTLGYTKQLEIIGVGYQARMKGPELELVVGFAHSVMMTPPPQTTVTLPNPTVVIISGPDRQAVGEFAAKCRNVRPPEPYKGKGIKYKDEVIRRKAGKAFVTSE